jgi:hypothetical protein
VQEGKSYLSTEARESALQKPEVVTLQKPEVTKSAKLVSNAPPPPPHLR